MIRVCKIIGVFILVLFAGIGMTFTAVFVAMNFDLLNVRGSIEERNAFFESVPRLPFVNATTTGTPLAEPATSGCLGQEDPQAKCEWNMTREWSVVQGGLTKDADIINRVAKETGVSPRMITAAVLPEQIRFFSDNREIFKSYFEPLKILVSLSKFSLGVSGIKQETAAEIEQYANNPDSVFYPGPDIAKLIAYNDETNRDTELFNRLTDEKNHYYSYLYTAIYLKQIEAQWQRAGYDISDRPDVLVTLFNLGFAASSPKENPQVAGARITIGGQGYSFGYLGTLYYQSDELLDIFPR